MKEIVQDCDYIVVLNTAFIGDLVISSGVLSFLKDRFPSKQVVLITTSTGRGLFQGEPYIDHCLVFDKPGPIGMWKLRQRLRDLPLFSADRALLIRMHKSYRSGLLACMLGLPTVTYDESAIAFTAGVRVPRVGVLKEFERLALLLEPLGFEREELFLQAQPRLTTGEPPTGFSITGPYIAVAPGSVWATKRWESYGQLIQQILDKTRLQVVLIGSPNEAKLCRDIEKHVSHAGRVHNWAARTSMLELKYVIKNASMLLANDSSPVHFADAMGVPVAAIFGSTIPQMGFGPISQDATVIETPLSCRPCSDHGPDRCPLDHFQCMRGLTAERVLTHLVSWPPFAQYVIS